ncbi:MAG: F-type H+-transporting ATPase subunit b [Cryomorphaceae bacterium]|jgi:F-type H+-transporting ATPase subunit b
MLIDWFTVGAQVLNFLILVWLMKHFLYQPVLNSIDAREKRIADQIADAEAIEVVASRERDDFKQKNDEFDEQRDAMLAKVSDEAKTERQSLMDEARKDSDALSFKRDESRKNEARNLTEAISQRTQQEVFAIARKTLGDLATLDLEKSVVDVFARRLSDLDGTAKEKLASAIKASSEPILVSSAFELPAEEQSNVRDAINETFSVDVQLQFETSPEIVSGIELNVGGQKLAWSIAEYLTSLETGVGELLKKSSC